jgi:hypothetical protein
MTKTITEFQPLIYQRMFAQREQRRGRRRHWLQTVAWALPALYVVLGIKITADTGIAPWNWQFWLMFAPLFVFAERVVWSLSRRTPALPQSVKA